MCLLCWRRTLLSRGMNVFYACDERFGTGDELVKNAHSNFSHTHTASYQRLSNRTYLEMIASHRYSPSKMGGSYHVFVLASNYATPTSYIYAIAFSAGLNFCSEIFQSRLHKYRNLGNFHC